METIRFGSLFLLAYVQLHSQEKIYLDVASVQNSLHFLGHFNKFSH